MKKFVHGWMTHFLFCPKIESKIFFLHIINNILNMRRTYVRIIGIDSEKNGVLMHSL